MAWNMKETLLQITIHNTIHNPSIVGSEVVSTVLDLATHFLLHHVIVYLDFVLIYLRHTFTIIYGAVHLHRYDIRHVSLFVFHNYASILLAI